MNKTLSTTLTVLAVLALAAVIFFAGSMYARMNMNVFGPGNMMSGYSWNNNNAYGPGGMMSSNGGMMNGYNNVNLTPLTVDQTKAAADKYLANLNNSDLDLVEIMIFDNNGYVIVKEASTGIGAFELLVDPVSQIAYPEHGPNMMWNLKYSGLNHEYMLSGGMMNMILAPGAHLPWRAVPGSAGVGSYGHTMMQGWNNTTPLDLTVEMTVTPEQAVEYAQQYLDANIASASTEHPMQFYGYYTLDFEKDGKVAGMLSVNGYNGQIFLHTWHGAFIEETEYE